MYLKRRYNKAFTFFIMFQFFVVIFFIYFPLSSQVSKFRDFYTNTQVRIFESIMEKRRSDLWEKVVVTAVSDDLYRQVFLREERWLDNYLAGLVNDPLGIDSVILLNQSKEVVYAKTKQFDIFPEFLEANFIDQALNNMTYRTGMIRHNDQIYLIGFSPVVTSTRRFSPNGVLIFVQVVNDYFIEQKIKPFMDQEILIEICTNYPSDSIYAYGTISVTSFDGDLIGHIILQPSHPFFTNIKTLFTRNILFSMFLLFALFIVISQVISKKLTQRIDLLSNEVKTAVRRNFNYEIRVSGKDEISGLAESFNSMSKTMKVHVEEIYKTNKKLQKTFLEIIQGLVTAIEVKDCYTRGHSHRVMVYSELIGRKMRFPDIETVRMAALLHDVGKIGIPENILNKPGRLTNEEFEIIKAHPDHGYKILSNIEGFNRVKDIIRFHHERIDGKGYPSGMKGTLIPIEARIIAVADTFDAITSDRAYRKGMSVHEALAELQRVKGTQLDTMIVDIFIQIAIEHNYFDEFLKLKEGLNTDESLQKKILNLA